MKRLTIILVVVFALIVSGLLLRQTRHTEETNSAPSFERVVSLAPSATEVLFALGLGDRVAGVTRYCKYPPEAQERTSVGGFLDPSYEAIVALKPGVVVLLTIHNDARARLDELGIPTHVVDHRTVPGILESIHSVAKAASIPERGDELVAGIEARMDAIRRQNTGRRRPTVLLSAGRDYAAGSLAEVYVAGKNQWYDDVITLAGGQNVFADKGVQFPRLTGEGILRLDPDIIIEMAPKNANRDLTAEEIADDWEQFPTLRAVQRGHIYVLRDDYVTIPGPRFIRAVEDVAAAIRDATEADTP